MLCSAHAQMYTALSELLSAEDGTPEVEFLSAAELGLTGQSLPFGVVQRLVAGRGRERVRLQERLHGAGPLQRALEHLAPPAARAHRHQPRRVRDAERLCAVRRAPCVGAAVPAADQELPPRG